jgi:hypothetical protein
VVSETQSREDQELSTVPLKEIKPIIEMVSSSEFTCTLIVTITISVFVPGRYKN